MRIKIKLLKPFSDAVGKGEFDFEFIGSTLGSLIKELTNKYPNLRNEFYNESKELTDYSLKIAKKLKGVYVDKTNTNFYGICKQCKGVIK